MLTYIINLDRQPGRMERIARLLGGVAFERVSAVDGTALQGPERRIKDVPTQPEDLTRFERAVALSHREAWKRLSESGAIAACILEDDVVISADFAKFVQSEEWIPADADLVKIEAFSRRKLLMGPEIHRHEGRAIRRLLSNNLGAAAYIITAKGAAKFLAQTEVLSRPIDHTLFEDFLQDDTFRIYQLCPALCAQTERFGKSSAHPEFVSTIQGHKQFRLTVPEKVSREFKRPFLSSHKFVKNFIHYTLRDGKMEKVEFL